MQKANGSRDALQEPPGRNEEINGILKKGRTIAFDGMSHKLQDPTGNE